jgi:type IV secretion system protein VirB10
VTQLPVDGLVLQGTRIPVVGLEAVTSDIPGMLTARSTVDIYDSLHQRRVAIPRHTRFIGSYSSEIRPGQTRVLFAFRRMVLPDGRSVDLSAAQGVDNIGRAGIEGDVDNHFLKMFGHSFAIAWISSKLSNRDGLTTSSTTNGQTSTGTVAGEVLSQVAQQILQRNAHIPPTISLPVGFPFFITLSKDVVLAPVGVSNVR